MAQAQLLSLHNPQNITVLWVVASHLKTRGLVKKFCWKQYIIITITYYTKYNIFYTVFLFIGSGIFSPDKVVPYYYNMMNESGHLLISELNSHPRNSSTYYPITWNLYASQIENSPSGSNVFNGYLFADEYTFTELKELHGEHSICQNAFCCHINYRMAEKQSDEVYVFGVFNGLHIVEGEYYLQVIFPFYC